MLCYVLGKLDCLAACLELQEGQLKLAIGVYPHDPHGRLCSLHGTAHIQTSPAATSPRSST